MHHTSATRGHWIVAIGAVVIVGSCFLQWWQIGGGPSELPAHDRHGHRRGRRLHADVPARRRDACCC